jgi:gliding motility-associated-like protein
MKKIYRNYIYLICLFLISLSSIIAQPCVKIESILVAACTSPGSPEGSNEMMRFRVGNTPLNTANMNIVWGSGQYPYSGVVQNANTANIVAQLNSTILSCGYLKEPVNGILPPNSQVLMITGTNTSTTANSFAQLSDTLWIIFHNATNPGGHFLNYNTNPGNANAQATTISFFNIPNCSSTATYFRSDLLNIFGVTPTGNSTPDEPGASVRFDENMNPTYFNNGCIASIGGVSADWNAPGSICEYEEPINLDSLVTGTPGGFWTGDGVSGNIFNPQGLSGFANITYNVVNIVCGDTISFSQVITVNPKPNTPFFITTNPLCEGSPLILTVDNITPTSTYKFILPNGTVTTGNSLNFGQATESNNGTYGLVVSVHGCESDTFFSEINLNPIQQPVISGSSYVCNEVPTELSVEGDYVSFLWSTQSTTDTVMVLSGEYTVTAIDANGCPATSEPFIVGDSSPEALIVGLTTFCQGDSILIYSSGDYPEYLWSNGSTNDSIYVYGGEATLIVTDQFGCKDTTVIILSPIAVPNAAFSVEPEGLVNSNVNIQFTDLSTNADDISIIRWEWFFGDGNQSDIQNPIHAYDQPGSYNVMLVVMNLYGCYDTTYVTVNIVDEVKIPNVFTPNNDGINDFFEIENIQFFDGNFVVIMNRWGKKVFESQNYNNDTIKWDGEGEPAGVYFYIVDIPDKEPQKGTVTLIKNKQ